MVNRKTHPLDQFLQQRMQQGNISTTTLVLTFFCDVVTQHGGEIWLGSIIHALSPLGISERLTRTSVFRLTQDGWLTSRKQGRRSYYRLTVTGQNYYQRAASRIYASHRPDWDGKWTLLLTSLVSEEKRDALNRGLSWLGYGRLAAGVFALPCKASREVEELLTDLGIEDDLVTMRAEAECDESLRKLVLSRWNLDGLKERYRQFINSYLVARNTLYASQAASAHSLFLLRVLLIHEYRRILLNDPELPAAMVPSDWEADTARNLTAEIYRQIAVPGSQWVSEEMFDSEGHLKYDLGMMDKRFVH